MRQNKRLALTNQTWPLGGNAEKIWAVLMQVSKMWKSNNAISSVVHVVRIC